MSLVALVFTAASVSVTPCAVAHPSDTLRAALTAARGDSCGPLRSDPTVELAADKLNQSDDQWLDHKTRAVPVEIAAPAGAPADPVPTLRDLGYEAKEGALLSGAGTTTAESIKAILVQGYNKIPNCAYAVYGVSARHNSSKNLILTTIVLAT